MIFDKVSPANSEQDQDIVVSYRPRTLLVYGKVVSAIGWIIAFIGTFVLIAGITEIQKNESIIVIGVGFIVMSTGIAMILFGQSISCFVSIEKNTRHTYELLKQK